MRLQNLAIKHTLHIIPAIDAWEISGNCGNVRQNYVSAVLLY